MCHVDVCSDYLGRNLCDHWLDLFGNWNLRGLWRELVFLDLRGLLNRNLDLLRLYLWLFHGSLRNRYFLVDRGLMLIRSCLDNCRHLWLGVLN